MIKTKNKILNLLLIFLIIAGVSSIGVWTVGLVNAASENYHDLNIFIEVMKKVEENYVKEVKIKDLIEGAIRGMVGTLDPHSSFMDADVFKEMQIDTKGEFGGLGIQISIKEGILTVIAPIEDTPAYRAGIMAGDKILKVNGESTKEMTLLDAVHRMRGPKGTEVTITVYREGWEKPKDFTIIRDIIRVKSVKYKIIDDSIGYIKITQFQEKTSSDLGKAIEELLGSDINSIILDLRNNPGGLLPSAVSVADHFLPPKKLVVFIKNRKGEKVEFTTEKEGMLTDMPMVVLVNHGSASASEIVAGALKDWERAFLIGVTTFGKGSVQSVLPLSEGAGLRLTTAIYYTPKGTSIQNTGITPDIVVELKPVDISMHPVIREKDLERRLDNEKTKKEIPEKKEMVPSEIKEGEDLQLQRAIDILKTWHIFKKLPEAA